MRNLIGLTLVLLFAGCSGGFGGSAAVDTEEARGSMAATAGFAAAVANIPNTTNPDYYPPEGHKPNPSPTPNPSPSGKCTNCDGRHWIGDGRIMKPCPVCNADGKLPLTANEAGEYVPYVPEPSPKPLDNPFDYKPVPRSVTGSEGQTALPPAPPTPPHSPSSKQKSINFCRHWNPSRLSRPKLFRLLLCGFLRLTQRSSDPGFEMLNRSGKRANGSFGSRTFRPGINPTFWSLMS